jgi:hypothetical protein
MKLLASPEARWHLPPVNQRSPAPLATTIPTEHMTQLRKCLAERHAAMFWLESDPADQSGRQTFEEQQSSQRAPRTLVPLLHGKRQQH